MNKEYSIGHAPFHIGYEYYDGKGYFDLNCCITALMIGYGNTLSQQKMYEYYSVTKDYIMGAANLKEDAVDFGAASTHNLSETMLNQFDIFPLHSHAKSISGTTPSIYDVRRVSSEDRDRTYQFNNQIKRYAYVADEVGRLEYSLEGFSGGTIMMRAFISTDADTSQYFFQLKDAKGQTLSLYRNSSKYLAIELNEKIYLTDLTFDTKKWHTIGLSFTKGEEFESVESGYSTNMRVYLDGKIYSTLRAINSPFNQLKLSLGKRFDTTNPSNVIHKGCYPLLGQIEMLATRPTHCELSTLNTLSNELKDTTKVSEYNELGLLQKKIINHQGNDVLTNEYTYKLRTVTDQFSSKQIQKEKIKYGSSVVDISYGYDDLDRLTEIKDTIFGTHSYDYNNRGFLEYEGNTKYEYDSNGNIKSISLCDSNGKVLSVQTSFDYDTSTMKDRLTKVNGTPITYGTNPLNPASYNGNTYTFKGSRLVQCNAYKYTYNDLGLRVSKSVNSTLIKFYYDGNLLITEDRTSRRFDFLYDENNELYGFIFNKQEKYFYIKDFMSNIVGII
ncbi:MAG: hypothetical protein K2J85_05430, partial [Anaeroplasmataceae bacterium]|nr:hypothetical protein [Anaeroplasmataceae bacterium]